MKIMTEQQIGAYYHNLLFASYYAIFPLRPKGSSDTNFGDCGLLGCKQGMFHPFFCLELQLLM